jgi:manganese efflux pump family protein
MRLTRAQRLRVWVLFIAFEAGMPLVGMALGAPLAPLAGRPAHLVIDPYQLGSPNEAYQLRLADQTHLAETVDVTFVGRYIAPIIVSVIGLGVGISLDELVVGFTISFSKLPVADVITAIVVQAFLAVMADQLLGRTARAGSLRIDADRITHGSKLAAGSVLVALSAVLLVGPPVVAHVLPHHRVGHYVAPPAVSTSEP